VSHSITARNAVICGTTTWPAETHSVFIAANADLWSALMPWDVERDEQGKPERMLWSRPEQERRATNTQTVADLFKRRPYQWIGTLELEKAGGRNAWRTRVSDARKQFEKSGWTITNRQIRLDGAVISEYRYERVPLGRDASTYVEQSLPWIL
jgi:hypothetical protein